MIAYPTVPGITRRTPFGNPCFGFYKYDGSNLRFEWSQKKGWHKFGSRTQLIDRSSPTLGKGIDIFLDTMADDILNKLHSNYGGKKFKQYNERVVAFAELYGPNSFAGTHNDSDKFELKLIDVSLYKLGFVDPKTFVDVFGNSDYAAKLLYQGNFNRELIDSVRRGNLPDGTALNFMQEIPEGIVCKGLIEKQVWMSKIKTRSYLLKLLEYTPSGEAEMKDQGFEDGVI